MFVDATSPGMLLAATALIHLPRLSHFCAHRAGWRNRSGRTTGRTFDGRSGLVSGDVYERESAASVYEREGRDPNQQNPHFEQDRVRAQAVGQVLIRHAG